MGLGQLHDLDRRPAIANELKGFTAYTGDPDGLVPSAQLLPQHLARQRKKLRAVRITQGTEDFVLHLANNR